MLEQFLTMLQGIPHPLVVMLVAMTPIFELRGAIPVAMGAFQMSVWEAAFWSIVGNMIPAFFILYGWGAVIAFLERRLPRFHQFMDRHHHALHMKWEKSIDTYGPWALALFVAVPLPLSGVWSGALVAWIFGMHKRAALLSIFIGVVIAAAIVTFLTGASIRIL